MDGPITEEVETEDVDVEEAEVLMDELLRYHTRIVSNNHTHISL